MNKRWKKYADTKEFVEMTEHSEGIEIDGSMLVQIAHPAQQLLKMLSKAAGNMVKLVDWADRWLKVILEV